MSFVTCTILAARSERRRKDDDANLSRADFSGRLGTPRSCEIVAFIAVIVILSISPTAKAVLSSMVLHRETLTLLTSLLPLSIPLDKPHEHAEILIPRSNKRNLNAVKKPTRRSQAEPQPRRDRHGIGRRTTVIHRRRIVSCKPDREFLEVPHFIKSQESTDRQIGIECRVQSRRRQRNRRAGAAADHPAIGQTVPELDLRSERCITVARGERARRSSNRQHRHDRGIFGLTQQYLGRDADVSETRPIRRTRVSG